MFIGVIRNEDILRRVQCMLEESQKKKIKSNICEVRLNKGFRVIQLEMRRDVIIVIIDKDLLQNIMINCLFLLIYEKKKV